MVFLPIKWNILVIFLFMIYFCDQNLKIIYLGELLLMYLITIYILYIYEYFNYKPHTWKGIFPCIIIISFTMMFKFVVREVNGKWQRNWFRYKATSLFSFLLQETEQKFHFRKYNSLSTYIWTCKMGPNVIYFNTNI